MLVSFPRGTDGLIMKFIWRFKCKMKHPIEHVQQKICRKKNSARLQLIKMGHKEISIYLFVIYLYVSLIYLYMAVSGK